MKRYQGRYRNAHVDAVRVYGTVVPPTATHTPTPTETPTVDPCGGGLNAVTSSEVGMLDVAQNWTPLGQSGTLPAVFSLVTTGDATISIDLIRDATTRNVLLCHAIVWEIPGTTPGQSLLFVGGFTPLNPSIVPQGVNFACRGAHLLPGAQIPRFLNAPLLPVDPTDYDPIELED